MADKFIRSSWSTQDKSFEIPLRPKTFDEFIGQINVQKRLKILIEAAQQRNEALGHCLISGPPGLGKTTLAYIISKTCDTHKPQKNSKQ